MVSSYVPSYNAADGNANTMKTSLWMESEGAKELKESKESCAFSSGISRLDSLMNYYQAHTASTALEVKEGMIPSLHLVATDGKHIKPAQDQVGSQSNFVVSHLWPSHLVRMVVSNDTSFRWWHQFAARGNDQLWLCEAVHQSFKH